MNPRLPSFFKTPRPRRFDLKPRYYDEKREAMERRVAAASGGAQDPAHVKERIRASFRDRRKASDAGRRAANVRLILILAALSVLSYLVLY